jgi:excinuclease ABC subunit A
LETGQKMVSYTEEQILETIKENYKGEKVLLLAPVIRSRKGHYHELFVQLAKKGYSQARIDGELQDIEYDLKLDRYKTHDIEVVIDRWIIGENATETRMPSNGNQFISRNFNINVFKIMFSCSVYFDVFFFCTHFH